MEDKQNELYTFIEVLLENNILSDKTYYKIEEVLKNISEYDSKLAEQVTDVFLEVKEEYFNIGVIAGQMGNNIL